MHNKNDRGIDALVKCFPRGHQCGWHKVGHPAAGLSSSLWFLRSGSSVSVFILTRRSSSALAEGN